jgi:hypothetical protein
MVQYEFLERSAFLQGEFGHSELIASPIPELTFPVLPRRSTEFAVSAGYEEAGRPLGGNSGAYAAIDKNA